MPEYLCKAPKTIKPTIRNMRRKTFYFLIGLIIMSIDLIHLAGSQMASQLL